MKIQLTEISIEQVINHSQSEYNPYEWKKRVNQLQKWFHEVRFYEHKNEVYYVYNSNGIRSINRLDYFSSLDNGNLKSYLFENDILDFYPIKVAKNNEGLGLAKELCKMSNKIVFASVYFNIN